MYSPIKMPRATKYGNNYWISNSYKIKRPVELYSDLENDHHLFVECDPDIADFCEQPLKLEFEVDGKIRTSIIDMWVKYRDGREEFREIKYESLLQEDDPKYYDTMRQIQIQKSWCEERGFIHRVITDKDLRDNQTLLDNYRLIAAFARSFDTLHSDVIEVITKKLLENESLTIGELIIYFNKLEPSEVQTTVAYLVYHGIVTANLEKLYFGNRTELDINESYFF
ncbi:TnsA endonuclease N-terminal domain-containing protein [Bacillus sp. AFS088145]|uniref:TnsA endonuclease N-terminal domain-containing protein n=1 Tax=Bacillus sp. AFS088145 TaxID=2033514 RepID=UPI000BF8FE79|nr:TnsA endonuclease N-terminal domain-containing protein [Bacillus sp. AFS088145]PFH91403.1 hypothetical protein COI44_02010 [Bacillus sp. AFS088145]